MIDHVNIVVEDLDRTVRFYEHALGMRPGFRGSLEGDWFETVTGFPGAKALCVFMESPDGGPRIELLQFLQPIGEALEVNSLPNTIGVRHLAFTVQDIDALVDRLQAAGVPFVSRPVEVPFVVGTMGRKRLCYFRDPDGTLLEAAAYG